MSFKRTKLRDAIYCALVVGATSALSTGAALAQDQPAAPANTAAPANVGTIVVTGTRIQSQTVTASSPVAEIGAEEFQYTGATRIDDLVNQYPQMNPYFDAYANNPSFGYPILDLRGLGPQRTLVLVDGNRLPPGASIFPDISIIPTALVKRVDILTGGASAVYGSDAVAGVVNFILDTDFEGVKFGAGISAYRHNNSNEYIQGKMDLRNFTYPTGDSGFDGVSKNLDMEIGGSFADGAGHAMAWLTWRQNEALFQSQRDYSSCALNAAGTGCGGSATNAAGDFYIYQHTADYSSYTTASASLNPDGSWAGHYGAPFNYAPLNYFQRPDTNYTFGTSVKYDVNEHFKPYMSAMYSDRTSATELAPSGAFFTQVSDPNNGPITCSTPFIGTLCDDLGFDNDPNRPLGIYVAKRNVEGGNRHNDTEISQWRIVAGAEGSINDNWSYNTSFLYGRTTSTTIGTGDFLSNRIVDAILQCTLGTTTNCVPYNVWVPGGVTAEAAAALQGTSINNTQTTLTSFNAYVTGDTGWSFPSAGGDTVSLVFGVEGRHDTYDFTADNDSQAGNFAGAGGPARPLSGTTTVKELFGEASIPIYKGDGWLKSFNSDVGYRLSDYDRSGKTHAYKIGFNADMGMWRARGGYNRAVRAPNAAELFSTPQIALFGGSDPCAGASPKYSADQCLNTGVSLARYGHIASNPAGQYNQFTSGNVDLTPETADTYTLGFVVQPMQDLTLNLDYYDIKISDVIAAPGAQNILNFCGLTGDPFLCSKVHRSAQGDLFRGSDPATSGFVDNKTINNGILKNRGLDFGASYNWDMFGGRAGVNVMGTYLLEQSTTTFPGQENAAGQLDPKALLVNPSLTPITGYYIFRARKTGFPDMVERIPLNNFVDCTGQENSACQSPDLRMLTEFHFSKGRWSANLRWRYTAALNDENTNIEFLDSSGNWVPDHDPTDKLVCANSEGAFPATNCLGKGGLSSANYFDISASVNLGESTDITFGVNNIADKEPPMVGVNNALNGNSPGGYDQLGRYFFANVTFKY